MDIWIYRDMEHGDMETLNRNGSPSDFPWSVYHFLTVQTEVCHLSGWWWRNKQKLSACKRTKRTCPSISMQIGNTGIVWHFMRMQITNNDFKLFCKTCS
jgi:hypothetical protein